MLIKVLGKKANLMTMALAVICMSAMFLLLGYLFGSNKSFLLGFATSTMTLGFGMLVVSIIQKIKNGKVSETKFDEREKYIAYKAGFTTYIITVFALCLFTFISYSSKLNVVIPSQNLAAYAIFGMTILFFSSMFIYRKIG